MSKQVHIRLNDEVYDVLMKLSNKSNESIQDTVSTAVMDLAGKTKTEEDRDYNFTFIDLFAGIGGMRIAYQNAGGKCVYSNEWNKYSQQTYFANFGERPDGDITKVDARVIPDHDILVAGFPCQPFSIAGVSKKNSLGRPTGFEDKTQGTLFFDVCRILKAKRPKAFMLENVKNLKSHDHGRTFKVIMESLEELNYQVFYEVLDGQNYVPQHRERILIVGFDRERYGSDVSFEFKITPKSPKPVMKNILETDVDPKYTLSDKLWVYLQNYAAKHRAAGNGFGYGIADPNGISRTLSARYYKDGSEILIAQPGQNPRRLTPRECARLQGFPDSFKIVVSDTQAYRQFGNSVVVPLMENVARLVVAEMNELDKKTHYWQAEVCLCRNIGGNMNAGFLNKYFSAIAVKHLSAVEADSDVSDQHEYNGVSLLKKMFGTDKPRKTIPTAFLYLSDDDDVIEATGSLTCYDARYNNPNRTEWRLYYWVW